MLHHLRNNYLLYLFLFLAALYFHADLLFEWPMYTHAWAQADRFALAHGFLWNNFNFFEAETFLMNLEFPGNFEHPKNNSVTMVNFPIHEYVIAIIMKVLGSNHPIIFRSYMLVWSWIGLLFLYKISLQFHLRKANRILLVVFAATSPVFIFYQANFLPSIPALALAFIGIYYYFNYYSTNKSRDFNFVIIAFTTAALYRTTYIIPFFALAIIESYRIIVGQSSLKTKLLPLFLMGLLFYLQHLHHQNQIHSEGSVFLYYLVPAQSFTHYLELVQLTFKNWKYDYLSLPQWIFVICLLVFGTIGLIRSAKQRDSTIIGLSFIIICVIGLLLFSFAMGTKFPDHDYYFLDTFYIPLQILVLILMVGVQELYRQYFRKTLVESTVFMGSTLAFMVAGQLNLEARMVNRFWDQSPEIVANFKGSSKVLDSLKIPIDAKILVLGNQIPNLPLLLMNRKGYSIGSKNGELIAKSLSWDFDYIAIQNTIYREHYYHLYPKFIQRTRAIYENESISILELAPIDTSVNLNSFFKNSTPNPIFISKISFEKENFPQWNNTQRIKLNKGNRMYVGHVSSEIEYGATYKTIKDYSQENKINLVGVLGFIAAKNPIKDFYAVLSVTQDGEKVYYHQHNLATRVDSNLIFNPFYIEFEIPEIHFSSRTEFAFYFWNQKLEEVYYDDLEIRFY